MTDVSPAERESLSLSDLKHLNSAGDRFESDWRAGRSPQIEVFLAECADRVRSALFRHLLRQELDNRARTGELPAPEEYRLRFPEHREAVDGVFKQRAHAGPPVPAPDTAAPGVAQPETAWPQPATEAVTVPVIPGFTILEKIDQGGMGIVYKARQGTPDRVVALKMILAGQFARPEDVARFRKEGKAAAQLDHPNIVRCYDFGEHGGLPYYTMEFVGGGSLKEWLARGRLPSHDAARLIQTLARAMHYAHERGVVHRDLKPANILLEASDSFAPGAAKIADFGLAKRLGQDSVPTQSGVVMGTLPYMSPEQAAGNTREIGPLADVYALGAILYEVLTGQPLFRGESPIATFRKIADEEPTPPSLIQPEVPRDLETICLKCLRKEPGQRYADAAALSQDLERYLKGELIAAEALGEWHWRERWAQQLGFELLEVLKVGIDGVVYKARQTHVNRLVTLHIIPSERYRDASAAERRRWRIEAAAGLQHPNITQIYGSGEQGGALYFCQEHTTGGNLAERCADAPASPRQAAEWVAKLARALHYAHQRGLVHGALKPSRVLLSEDDEPKIADFSRDHLAAFVQDMVEATRKGRRHVRPLAGYRAPELLRGRVKELGPATDIYALGGILYRLLTGRPPFDLEAPGSPTEADSWPVLVPPSRLQSVPQELEAVCLKCLQPIPAQRYASAAALAEDLRRFLELGEQDTGEFELVPGYELLQELGRGGIGVVYKARQINLDRLVALKIFHEQLDRVLAANQAMARLHHPHIVQVFDSGERFPHLYVAEEFVEGGNLAQRIAANGTQSPRDAAELVETLARAMHHVHGYGIVHRNLKPQVVLFTGDGVPKISSFDLARLVKQDSAEAEGQVIGSPFYMAPEQAAGRLQDIGPATDVYGLGAVLYELLTGRRPFHAEVIQEALEHVQTGKVEPPSRAHPQVPRDLDAICLKCLAKDPGERYASAEALADDLSRFRDGRRVSVHPPGIWAQIRQWLASP